MTLPIWILYCNVKPRSQADIKRRFNQIQTASILQRGSTTFKQQLRSVLTDAINDVTKSKLEETVKHALLQLLKLMLIRCQTSLRTLDTQSVFTDRNLLSVVGSYLPEIIQEEYETMKLIRDVQQEERETLVISETLLTNTPTFSSPKWLRPLRFHFEDDATLFRNTTTRPDSH